MHSCIIVKVWFGVNADMHEIMQKGLADRVTGVRDKLGSTKALQEKSGVDQSYLSRIMNGLIKNPGSLQLIKIATAGDVSIDYLLTGVSGDKSVAVPVAGLESHNSFYMDKCILDRLGVVQEHVRGYVYSGDTMNCYQPGDWLLVNINNPAGDGIYLADFGGGITVRRLSWIPGGLVSVSSDNYGTDQVCPKDLNIIGKVIWAGVRQ